MARPNPNHLPDHGSQSSDLQWIITTDPRQSVDRDTMRTLRSHVMNNYLQREHQNPHTTDVRVRGGVEKRRRAPSHSTRPSSSARQVESGGRRTATSSSATSSAPSQPAASSSDETDSLEQTVEEDENLKLVLATRDSVKSSSSPREVVEPQMNINFENLRVKYYSLSKMYALLGKGFRLEPDEVTSWIENPEIDVQVLKRSCLVNFGNKGLMKIWLPMVSQTRQTFLSSLCASAAYLDAMELTSSVSSRARPVDSLRTRVLFQEIIRLINKSMSDVRTRTSDATITTVLQLLCGELMVANDAVLQLHEEGLWSMVGQRGGLDKLGSNGAIASLLVITAFELSIFRETQPRAAYLNYANAMPASSSAQGSEKAVPESPAYSPFNDLPTVRSDKKCSRKTLDLIQTTRELTSVSIEDGDRRSTEVEPAVSGTTPVGPQLPPAISARVYNAVYRIFAYRQDMNDSVHEAIRLCARLYASAIWYKIPLSVAARPPRAEDKVQHIFCGVTPGFIKQALERTDLSTCWDGMIGVLFWVTVVSGAACNNPSLAAAWTGTAQDIIPLGSNPAASNGAAGTRKWLIALAMRCSIMLCFEHPAAVAETLQRLLKIQDLLSQGGYESSFVEEETVSDGPAIP